MPSEATMASNESEGVDDPKAILPPTILPLSPDEVKERLTLLLELQGVTIDTFEEKLRVQGPTLQIVVFSDSSATHPSSQSSPTTPTGSSTEGLPLYHPIATREAYESDSDSVTKRLTGIPKQEPGFAADADADLVASMADLAIGEEAPKRMDFCPWRMVQNYPDWFIGKANAPRVSSLPSAFRAFFWGEAQILTSTGPAVLRRVSHPSRVGFVRPRYAFRCHYQVC